MTNKSEFDDGFNDVQELERAVEIVQDAIDELERRDEGFSGALQSIRDAITAEVARLMQERGMPPWSSRFRHADGGVHGLVYRLLFTVGANSRLLPRKVIE